MNLSKITAVALAASLGLASVAGAQPSHGPDRGPTPQQHGGRPGAMPAPQHVQPQGPRGTVQPSNRLPAPLARGAGPDRQFHKGQRLPAEWRHRQYVVNDWRAHHLTPPPRGQQWVQVGADFVLVAVATGVITSLILNN